jgi:hypothetical protein
MPKASQAQLAYHPTAARPHPVGRRHRRERVRHPDLVRSRIQHERVGFVQLTPALEYVGLVPELSRSGRTPELDEGCVRAVTKSQQLGVDLPTLARPFVDADHRQPSSEADPTGVRDGRLA